MPNLFKEQKTVVYHNDGNILVSASAGSGKTFVMIERILRLIVEGRAQVKEILATTFTEASALDMKNKLKRAIIDKINQLNVNGDKAGADYLTTQLGEIATADISTLHSFCARLIRTYFFTVGVAPDFVIADESRSAELRNMALDSLFRELYESEDNEFLTLVNRHSSKRSDKGLKKSVLDLHRFCFSEAKPFEILNKSQKYYTDEGHTELLDALNGERKANLNEILNILQNALNQLESLNTKNGVQFVKELISDTEYLLYEQDVFKSYAYEGVNRTLNFGRKNPESELVIKQSVKACHEKLKKMQAQAKQLLADGQFDEQKIEQLKIHSQGLCKLVRRYDEIYSQLKNEENLLDFSDLEHFSLKILENEEVKQAVRNKYKYIFVDEYQDINGVQESIISTIANDNLFMVGDVKQSIYGFRGCRSDFFSNKLERMKSSGQTTVELNYNFRSAPKVIELVNQVFSYSMKKDFFGIDYEGTSKLVSGGVYLDDDNKEFEGRAEVHFLERVKQEKQVEKPRIYNLLDEVKKLGENPSNDLSKLIADIIEKELHKQYYDIKTKSYKQVTFDDIAILTRNRDNLYVKGLINGLARHGIPVISEVAEDICSFPEISMLVSCLRLVNSFNDDVSLATALKSPIGRFTDEDLYQIVSYYKSNAGKLYDRNYTFYHAFSFYVERAKDSLKERLERFVEYFDRLRLISDFTCAHDVMAKMVADSSFEAYLYVQPNGNLRVDRVRKLISASVKGGKALSVKEFLDLIDSPDNQIKLIGSGENGVTVMTIHASKGLEFPVVIVCGLERGQNTSAEREEILLDRTYGFAVKYYDDQEKLYYSTLLRTVIKSKMAKERIKEELRLFYVALTRAKCSLHLTFEGDKDGRKEVFDGASSFWDYLPNSIKVTHVDANSLKTTHQVKGVRKVLIAQENEDATRLLQGNFNFIYPYQRNTTLPLKSSVTDALKLDEYHTDLDVYSLFNEEIPTTDKERGIIAHKVLELLDFSNRLKLEEEINRLVYENKISLQDIQKINVENIQKALMNDIFNGVDGKNIYREQSFIVSLPSKQVLTDGNDTQILVQGVIDLLIEDQDGFTVIDYKYSKLNAKALLQKYSKQIELYSIALQKVTGKKVNKRAILNLVSGEVIIL